MTSATSTLALLALLPGVAAPALSQTFDTTAFDEAVRAEMRATRAPGVAVAVVQGGRILFAKGYGVESMEEARPITPTTLFRIGSVTKAFTGLTAALMAQDGKVRLDAPIAGYTPGVSVSIGQRTLHDLLTHTGGFIAEAAGDGPHDDGALGARVRAWGDEHLFAERGDVYSYSGPGYWLAGYALEQASGAWYADLVQRRVLAPLDMTRSTFRPTVAMTYPLALDHRVAPAGVSVLRPFSDDASTWPSGSLFSNVMELARFSIAIMDSGRIDGRRVFPAEAIAQLTTKKSGVSSERCGYSYGLSVCDAPPARTLSHYGFRVGSGAVLTMVPDQKSAVIILANRNGGIFAASERRALSLLGVAEAPSTRSAPRRMTAGERTRFAGAYAAGSDTLRLLIRHDSLLFRFQDRDFATARGADDEVLVLGEGGRVDQAFRLVRGNRTAAAYLHDGLNAFRRMPPS